MIAILGDVHFASSRDYLIQISNAIIKWFASWKYNNASNELILVGDLVHSAINGGIVIDFVEKFVKSSKFAHIHIVVGNHDVKRRDGIVQLAYEFLRNKPNITIYGRKSITKIQGKTCLMLPYYIAENGEQPMVDHYSSLYKSINAVDLTIGHFMEESVSYGLADVVQNISKINTKILCLGHLHVRTNPNIYIGSVYATKINEDDDRRAAWIIDDNNTKIEDPLPTFCKYVTVKYPQPLEPTNAIVPIYTITNCSTEAVARLTYGDIAIRKVLQQLVIPTRESVSEDSTPLADLDINSMFKEFMKTSPIPLDRRVATLCMSMLKNPTNLVENDQDRNTSTAVL